MSSKETGVRNCMQEFMLATKAMELLREIRGLREDAELEVRKYIS
jgi:hypothetical protein